MDCGNYRQRLMPDDELIEFVCTENENRPHASSKFEVSISLKSPYGTSVVRAHSFEEASVWKP